MRLSLLLAATLPLFADSHLPPGVKFYRGAVNSVVVEGLLAVYSEASPVADTLPLLLTESRRDAIGTLPGNGRVHVPETASQRFLRPEIFWEQLETGRFHDYNQNTTKGPVKPISALTAIPGQLVEEVATPGYSPNAVSYVITSGGKRIVCTGDLIYGNGQILDLYSLQDAVPEAKARGYHGYAARAADEIASLRRVAQLHPDVLLPAHGPMITNPRQSIALLIDRLQNFLQSHYETDALRWYWGDKNLTIRSKAVEKPLNIMPMADQTKLPPDILAIGNSRVILSKTGAAFVVDAGYARTLPELQRMRASGEIKSVDGIWITHYHDDHTDHVNDVVKEFGSKVYFTKAMTEVLVKPGAFRLPCLTDQPIPAVDAKSDGEILQWHEWRFTFWNFPGQTLYHGGLVATRNDGQTYLFTGDSFTPSGMDDYCMQNRDILRRGEGYEYCLRKMSTLPPRAWLLNQHVEPMFRFTKEQMERMRRELEKRSAILREMSPWPDINYMVDESWARTFPYAQESKPNEVFGISLRITNHAPAETAYRVQWNLPPGIHMISAEPVVKIAARSEGRVEARFRASSTGLHLITADVNFDNWQLPQWSEAMVRVR